MLCAAARWSEAKRLTLRGMEAHGLSNSRAPVKKFVVFRFGANAVLSWASLLSPNRVGIPTKKLKQWTVYGNRFAHNWEDSLCARCYSLPVLALDLNNEGKILWKYEPRQDPNVIPIMCCDTVNRGVAYADGKIFLHQADTTLVALDAKTGKVVWSVMDGEAGKGQSGTDAPFVFKDKVLVGISGGEFGVKGWVSAYNIKDGKLVWRAFSEGPDSDMLIDPNKTTSLGKPVGPNSSLSTWQGDQWKIGGGATWGWYSYDPQLNLVYYGSGNPSTWNPVQRPGDNKWSMTIFARDLDTGQAKWVYQMTPHDEWDFDGVNEMILSDQTIGGAPRKLLTHFDRNGFGYTLDRATGELLVAEKYDPVVNWATKVDMDKSSKTYGRPLVVDAYSTQHNGEDTNSKGRSEEHTSEL